MASLVTTLQGYVPMGLSDRDRKVQAATSTMAQRDLLSGRTCAGEWSGTPVEEAGTQSAIRVIVPGRLPGWVQPTAESLAALLQLPHGWNSYGAKRTDAHVVCAAFDLLASVMEDDTPGPSIVPTTRGGVQLEWHTANIDMEITFHSPTRVEVYCEDIRTGQQWEGPLSLVLERLQGSLAKLPRQV